MVFNPLWLVGAGAILSGIGGLMGAETQRQTAREAKLTPEQKAYEATLYRLRLQKLEQQGLMPTFVSVPRLVPAQRQILSALLGPVAGFPEARGVPTGVSEMPVQRLPGRGPQAGLAELGKLPFDLGGLFEKAGVAPRIAGKLQQRQQMMGQQGMMGQAGMGKAGQGMPSVEQLQKQTQQMRALRQYQEELQRIIQDKQGE